MSEEDSQAISGGVVARELREEGCLVTFLTKIVPELDIFGVEIELREVGAEYVLFEYSVQVVYGGSHLIRLRKKRSVTLKLSSF